MSILDLLILVVIGALAVLGFWRGFIKEITETVGALVSAFCAYLLYEPVLTMLGFELASWGKKTLVFLSIFIALMIVISILGSLARKFIKSINLGLYDHLLGLISGALKGGIIVTVILTLATSIGPPLDEAVHNSKMARANLLVFDFLIDMFPESIQQSRLAELGLSVDSIDADEVRQRLFDLCPLPAAMTDSVLAARLLSIPGAGLALSLLDSTSKHDNHIAGVVSKMASANKEGSVEYKVGDSVFSVPWFVGSLNGSSISVAEVAVGDSVQFSVSYSRLLDRLCALEMELI